MPSEITFTPQDWSRIRHDYRAWWAHELDRALIYFQTYAEDPEIATPGYQRFTSEYGLDTPIDTIIEHAHRNLVNSRFYGDTFPRWQPNYGAGVVAAFLGAKMHSRPDTVWFEPSETTHAANLCIGKDENNPWWQRVKDVTSAGVQRWGNTVQLCHTDLGGNLDIIASLLTTNQLLFDVVDHPEVIDRLVRETTSVWLDYYDDLAEIIQPETGPASPGLTPWSPLWSDKRVYMLQCDFAYMISPAMFERFVMPDLVACCAKLDRGYYHLDGAGQLAHLDLLLEMDRLRGIQWEPGAGQPDSEKWPEVLTRIRDAGKLCQFWTSAEGALEVVRTLGGRGFFMVLRHDMPKDEAADFVALLEKEDISRH